MGSCDHGLVIGGEQFQGLSDNLSLPKLELSLPPIVLSWFLKNCGSFRIYNVSIHLPQDLKCGWWNQAVSCYRDVGLLISKSWEENISWACRHAHTNTHTHVCIHTHAFADELKYEKHFLPSLSICFVILDSQWRIIFPLCGKLHSVFHFCLLLKMFLERKKFCGFSTWITFQILKKKIYTLIFEQDVVGTFEAKRTSTIIFEYLIHLFPSTCYSVNIFL